MHVELDYTTVTPAGIAGKRVVPHTYLIGSVCGNGRKLECQVISTADGQFVTVVCAEPFVTVSYKELGLILNPKEVLAVSKFVSHRHLVYIGDFCVTVQTAAATAVDEVR